MELALPTLCVSPCTLFLELHQEMHSLLHEYQKQQGYKDISALLEYFQKDPKGLAVAVFEFVISDKTVVLSRHL